MIGTNIRLKRFINYTVSENFIGAGTFFFKQRYTNVLSDGSQKLNGFRANLYWTHKRTFNKQSDLSVTLNIQPKLDDFSDTDILLITTLITQLSKKLNLEVSANYSYLSTAPMGFEKDELR